MLSFTFIKKQKQNKHNNKNPGMDSIAYFNLMQLMTLLSLSSESPGPIISVYGFWTFDLVARALSAATVSFVFSRSRLCV